MSSQSGKGFFSFPMLSALSCEKAITDQSSAGKNSESKKSLLTGSSSRQQGSKLFFLCRVGPICKVERNHHSNVSNALGFVVFEG